MKKFAQPAILILLVGIVIYLAFGGFIKRVWRANQVLKMADVSGVGYYNLRCEDNHYPGEDVEAWKKCIDILQYYEARAKREWVPLIKQYQEIDCKDFRYKDDALSFYEYYGGGTYNAIIKSRYDGYRLADGSPYTLEAWMKSFTDSGGNTVAFSLVDLQKKYYYDPYHLDADANGIPCEHLPSKPLNEKDEPWRDWNNKL